MTRVRLKRRVLLSAQVRTALTIAGSDSGGGAGIQAYLKSFASIGVHGTSVITCVTAQNTRAVDSIFAIPTAEIRKQLRAVLDDFDVRAAKTGMLYSAGIVRAVANGLRRTSFPLVVDPVMIATVGARLEKDDFQAALVDRLFDRAALVTPNRYEAERLSGLPIRDVKEADQTPRDWVGWLSSRPRRAGAVAPRRDGRGSHGPDGSRRRGRRRAEGMAMQTRAPSPPSGGVDGMLIALFTNSYLPTVDGVVTSVLSTRRQLEAHGHEVVVFAPEDPRRRGTHEDGTVYVRAK